MTWSQNNHQQYPIGKILLLVGCAFFIACCLMIATIPLHECLHLAMSSCDPHLRVVAFYPFGVPQSQQHNQGFSTVLGCVVVKEAYHGAFQDRPVWADPLQEIICLSIQMIITCLITLKILGSLLIVKKPRFQTISLSSQKQSLS